MFQVNGSLMRYSPVTHIKAVGHADVTYGLAIHKDQ